jgi:hypothetical protein|tara:strand:- start:40 stop:465 length:426 start_codon:yes stop_codon:yes gene_type:complete
MLEDSIQQQIRSQACPCPRNRRTGCGNGWKLEYGEIAAPFTSSSITGKGNPYLGKKVTVKGKVTRRSLDKESGKLTMVLDDKVHCVWYGIRNDDDILLTAEDYQVGEIVYFDGFLTKCEPGKVVLDPVHSRDPTAPFEALE